MVKYVGHEIRAVIMNKLEMDVSRHCFTCKC